MKPFRKYLWNILALVFFSCQGEASYDASQKVSIEPVLSDYEFIDIAGARHLLNDVKAENKLLIFYDPQGKQSQQQIAEMKKSTQLADLIKKEKLRVVAICPVGDLNDWNTYKNTIPAQWINGFDIKGEASKKEFFAIKLYPTLLLINENNELLKRDADYQSLLSALDK
ncbi:hypothetical protein [Sphingobacterium ginsenosidimutans]|uniref:Thioredoxin domain-containing protein n=1 Tax=Sphingobacterium ginsenosidimutans TaxID=687845 RepID=A0ABP7ZWD0_9SPHI